MQRRGESPKQPRRSTDRSTGRQAWPKHAPLSRDEVARFGSGNHYRLYERLGAHAAQENGSAGVRFSVWAPAARRVFLIGDFNRWEPEATALTPVADSGVWSGFVEGVQLGDAYKFRIESRVENYSVDKSDPFARRTQIPPESASIYAEPRHQWRDGEWIATRTERDPERTPWSVYELHLGSWKRPAPGEMPNYREIADELTSYLLRMGFTHVEFLPLTEHPYYASWGYQTTGYFAPTARYGPPEDLMYLIDELHRAGIGVILDWVPSHFPTDAHGLSFFDGTYLFEHADPRQGFHPDWKTSIYNFGRGPVRSFLISSALFWIEQFHIDALRVDAVASMLYLDYSRDEGEWVPNEYGGRENLEAIAFLRQLNRTIHERHPGVAVIAEESTAWPMVSRPVHLGGLGFDMKWDMGWMHDTLEYTKLDPIHRKFHHEKLTFRSVYAFSERFMLPLSHDEVVHGKASLAAKMPGDPWQQFATLRCLLGQMYAQPGKKLLFMGAELGQWREWNHDAELDWELLQHAPHEGLQRWVADLNRLYRARPELHDYDFDGRGFEWIDGRDADQSVVCFLRKSRAGAPLLVACNFTPVPRHNYRIGLPRGGRWSELLNGDDLDYGGSGLVAPEPRSAVALSHHGKPHSIVLTLPPLATLFWQPEPMDDDEDADDTVPGAAIKPESPESDDKSSE